MNMNPTCHHGVLGSTPPGPNVPGNFASGRTSGVKITAAVTDGKMDQLKDVVGLEPSGEDGPTQGSFTLTSAVKQITQ